MGDKVILFFKALEAGDRWITVHPHGKGEKGQPVLIQQQSDGSAKVIGGAGGSLNHLRMTGVKPQSAYKEIISERAKARSASRKAQRERDKALGLSESKAAAHERLTALKRQADKQFVSEVARVVGWKPEEYQFDPSKHPGLSEQDMDKVRQAHEVDTVKRAMGTVDVNRKRLLADADARSAADLGEIPLESDDAVLSVQDLDPVRSEALGLGFSPEYGDRAEAGGLTGDELKAEAEAAKKPLSDGQAKAVERRAATAAAVQENIKYLREPDRVEKLSPKLVEAKQAVELLKLEKKMKMADRKVREARKKINESVTEPKAYVIDVDDATVDAKMSDDVANDLRTIRTRSFLSEVAKTAKNPTEALGRHIGVGAYNSVNALALAAGGAALVDRSVVDVLGIAGAAQVLARRLQSDLPPEEYRQVADGMQDYHLHHYMEASRDAMERARELQGQAREIEIGAAETGHDLAAMQEVNKRRAEAVGEAQKVLGQALGEMEANAALVLALQTGKTNTPFQVALGNVPVENAIKQARAIGLQRGDYALETAGGQRVLTVTPAGLDRLSAPVNRADLDQVRRNLDIISGKQDEANWLPLGISDRPDLDLHLKPGVAEQLAEPFAAGENIESSVRDYIGGRAADGDSPADIVADLQSADFARTVGPDRADQYRAILDSLAPLRDENGKMRSPEALRQAFEGMADSFVDNRYGGARTPLHRQRMKIDDVAGEALHRALAAEPSGVAAYKPIGEMTPQDQTALREFFGANVARETPEAAAQRHELEALEAAEPERTTRDMFGDEVVNPTWTSWRNRRDDLRQKVSSGSITWGKYVESMRGQENAYGAMQDLIRSRVSRSFADTYNTLNPKAPLKVGRTVIRGNLRHLDAVDPAKREARLAEERALIDRLRERSQGRYAAGGVGEKLNEVREQQAGFDAAQMGFFATQDTPAERPLDVDERFTIGQEAERQIASLMPQIGQNFKPGQPVKLIRPSMSGGTTAARQRAVKMIDANKRVVLSFGTGGGKTLISLGGFTNLQQQGKAKRGLFLVPSIVQGQFGAEALRFLKPGAFKWHAQPGASREERIAAYKDPTNHFVVMTHQSFRDDMVHLGAQHAGVSTEDMGGRLAAMPRAERKEWLRGVMRREGIAFDYLTVDEGHNTLNRKGKEDSELANVVDAMSDNANYYVNASADPVKNDVSEAFSLLQKMDPERYTDRDSFMRKYGVDTLASKDALRRELARLQYPSKIDPDISAKRIARKVTLNQDQNAAISQTDKMVTRARLARMQGKVDSEAMRALSPHSFAGVADDQVENVAADLQKNLGILRDAAVRETMNGGAKIDEVAKVAAEHRGRPGVVFAHSLENVEQIGARLQQEGYRVVTITGKDSAKEKSRKRQMFSPDKGDAEADILVASDAASTGLNAQRGNWLVNVDTPQTAMTHAQRNGRVNRIGQTHDVDLIDLVADHPEEARARKRLETKYALREMLTTPMESLDDTGLAYFLRQRQLASEKLL